MWKRLPLMPCVSWQHRELSFHLAAPLKFIARWVIYREESRCIHLNPNYMKPVPGWGRKGMCNPSAHCASNVRSQIFHYVKKRKMQHMCKTWICPFKVLWRTRFKYKRGWIGWIECWWYTHAVRSWNHLLDVDPLSNMNQSSSNAAQRTEEGNEHTTADVPLGSYSIIQRQWLIACFWVCQYLRMDTFFSEQSALGHGKIVL